MKILILAIYSYSDEYQKMLEIQRSYLHNYENVHTYFIDFRENQTNTIEIEDDFIYVKGINSYLNITYKTIEALEYALNNIKFDYVIRTNVSTIINVPELYKFCTYLPEKNVYTSGRMFDLQWLDIKGGIKDKSLFGVLFASGTSIIMSNDVVKFMVNNKSKIRYDIVDDVTIAIFMTNYFPSAYYPQTASFYIVPKNIKSNEVPIDYVFYRNRAHENRSGDIKNMEIVLNAIIRKPSKSPFLKMIIFLFLFLILVLLFWFFIFDSKKKYNFRRKRCK